MKKGMFSLSILGVILLLSENVMGVPNYAGEKGLKNILSANPERAGKFNYNIGFLCIY
ncbi:MAG: hypothetical protein HY769_01765 [Candidatus Stahlbacteria bacterium]|nr:hypothetical protein [Candidatus Stahlbacteria bacterium]